MISVVRRNLLSDKSYSPYCGADKCSHRWPRTYFVNNQFRCLCGWQSQYEPEFIQQVKEFRNGTSSN